MKLSKRGMIIALTILISISPSILIAQGQVQVTQTQQMVMIAEKASQQVQSLIDEVQSIENAGTAIKEIGLIEPYAANVTLYEIEGQTNLRAAQSAFENGDYQIAVNYAFDSLKVSRAVYTAIYSILQEAGLENNQLDDSQGLLDSINRQLQLIERLREVLPDNAPQEILDYLSSAQTLLDNAKSLLISGDLSTAKTSIISAKQDIYRVFVFLKQQAEESTQLRITEYCLRLQQRMQERFRYGADQGVDLTSTLKSLGYENEAQFMATLQDRIQKAQTEQSFQNIIQDCEQIGSMIQQMEQAVNQQINQHQGQNGAGGINSDYGNGGKP